jgi:hypothetical protein
VGVAIDGREVGEVVIGGNFGGALPMEESFLDGVAFGVAADSAFTFMARKFGT